MRKGLAVVMVAVGVMVGAARVAGASSPSVPCGTSVRLESVSAPSFDAAYRTASADGRVLDSMRIEPSVWVFALGR